VHPDEFAPALSQVEGPPVLVVDTLDIPPATIAPLRVEALEELPVPASGTLDIAPLDSGQ
jgi:hypothetical protein